MPGDIIFLNGTSSAGKTTLALALQEAFDEAWLHISLDQFRDGLPGKYRGLNAPTSSTGSLGLNVVPNRQREPHFTEVRFGEKGKQMLRGMRRAIAAFAAEGNNVIIDDIILEPSFLVDYLTALDGFNVWFVGVKCPIEVINEREAHRPGRFPGTAYGHLDTCHAHNRYDVEVDTSRSTPEDCARHIAGVMANGAPTAFSDLRATSKRVTERAT